MIQETWFWGQTEKWGSWALQRKPSFSTAGLIRTFNGLCYEQSQCLQGFGLASTALMQCP